MNLIVKSVGENSADYNFNDLISKDNNGNVEIKCFIIDFEICLFFKNLIYFNFIK